MGSWNGMKGFYGSPTAANNPSIPPRAVDFSNLLSSQVYQVDSINSNGTMWAINVTTPGTDLANRVGRKIVMKSIYITGFLSLTGNVTTAINEYLRFFMVYDRQPSQGQPTLATILADVGYAGNTPALGSMNGLNMNNVERFKILRDFRYNIPNNNTNTTTYFALSGALNDVNKNRVNIRDYVQLNNLEAMYTNAAPASSTDYTCMTSGVLWMCTLGSVASTANAFQMNWKTRLRFRT